MFRFLVFVTLALAGCHGLTVTHAPTNTAVEIGQNATIACIVTNKATTESVQWKFRTNGTTTFNAITFDTNILGDATKYAVVNQFNLTIISAATSDEGTYRCTAATTDYDAILTVVDLPTSAVITWSAEPNAGQTVNLTCTASNGRPTPNIRWLINGVDLSTNAYLETNSVSSSGYGNSVSNLPLSLTSDMDGNLAVCYVAYDGWDTAMNATLVLDINGSATVKVSFFLLSAITIFFTLM